jgi:hypothetical protein
LKELGWLQWAVVLTTHRFQYIFTRIVKVLTRIVPQYRIPTSLVVKYNVASTPSKAQDHLCNEYPGVKEVSRVALWPSDHHPATWDMQQGKRLAAAEPHLPQMLSGMHNIRADQGMHNEVQCSLSARTQSLDCGTHITWQLHRLRQQRLLVTLLQAAQDRKKPRGKWVISIFNKCRLEKGLTLIVLADATGPRVDDQCQSRVRESTSGCFFLHWGGCE